ncbi:hypothetical protein QAD02_011387 [Eretmocerus hayati]|uniref:Uncharacterized protein n=1 Tax=Eretmocerus hayati TaxID=131215 RepID=A0ACC2NXS9_9HYME|nr:hypothetical protein QAD02_011387 [Eretmocerus hayati]
MATSNSDIYSKIKNFMKLSHKLTMDLMNLHENLAINADEETRIRMDPILSEKLDCLEKEIGVTAETTTYWERKLTDDQVINGAPQIQHLVKHEHFSTSIGASGKSMKATRKWST